MGGLVARYFLRFGNADLPDNGEEASITWSGAQYVEKVIAAGYNIPNWKNGCSNLAAR